MADPAGPHALLIGIVGWSGSGKTTLIERLIAAFAARSVKVATIKHAHHPLRAYDGTTDGERHVQAGAIAVAVIAPEAWEISGVVQSTPPPPLAEVAARLGPADVVLVEGYKSLAIPKIEVRSPRARSTVPLADSDPDVIALASDEAPASANLPVFSRNDAAGLADFIAGRLPHLRP